MPFTPMFYSREQPFERTDAIPQPEPFDPSYPEFMFRSRPFRTRFPMHDPFLESFMHFSEFMNSQQFTHDHGPPPQFFSYPFSPAFHSPGGPFGPSPFHTHFFFPGTVPVFPMPPPPPPPPQAKPPPPRPRTPPSYHAYPPPPMNYASYAAPFHDSEPEDEEDLYDSPPPPFHYRRGSPTNFEMEDYPPTASSPPPSSPPPPSRPRPNARVRPQFFTRFHYSGRRPVPGQTANGCSPSPPEYREVESPSLPPRRAMNSPSPPPVNISPPDYRPPPSPPLPRNVSPIGYRPPQTAPPPRNVSPMGDPPQTRPRPGNVSPPRGTSRSAEKSATPRSEMFGTGSRDARTRSGLFRTRLSRNRTTPDNRDRAPRPQPVPRPAAMPQVPSGSARGAPGGVGSTPLSRPPAQPAWSESHPRRQDNPRARPSLWSKLF
jgi:hypothetical protein